MGKKGLCGWGRLSCSFSKTFTVVGRGLVSFTAVVGEGWRSMVRTTQTDGISSGSTASNWIREQNGQLVRITEKSNGGAGWIDC